MLSVVHVAASFALDGITFPIAKPPSAVQNCWALGYVFVVGKTTPCSLVSRLVHSV